MPSFPPELTNWLQSGFMGAGLAIVWTEVRAQGKRIDELRADMKEGFAQASADLQASEERQRQDVAELKADNRTLGEKLDRLVEALLTA
ncbi:MAG: hypothetical protein OXC47_03140, partial [Cyanobacteria bacterium MAG APA_bin_95]|nr:hypothetical protein [Cyanobacteria bacterium MAG APA_bin_95]